MRRFSYLILSLFCAITMFAQTGREKEFQKCALTPPMGWNSWDCYGPTVVESEVKANADYMALHLKDYGWKYVVVDIRWFVENDKAGGYNQTNPIYVYDEYGRYTPALNRFPSAANGVGFKALSDYVHDKGLKFGIHIMRGIPKEAVSKKLPVLGTNGLTADMIANNDSACTWLRDNMKVDWCKPGAQEYYNSIFDLYAQWGVDFIKIDDLARPYHTAEIGMIRNAIDQCGRPMVLSISPGETPIEKVDHVVNHANMWRTVDDFWDNWSQLNYQFSVCSKWAKHIAPGTWPDADMLPLGKISIRGERGAERYCLFTPDEQKTMMNLWNIFKSPLMFGGDLPQNDEATNALLTNKDVLWMHDYSVANREVYNRDNHLTWAAVNPMNGERYAALFNLGGSEFVAPKDALWRSGTISYLTTGYATDVDVTIPEGSRQLVLVATDGGDGYDSDHADWINPKIILKDGSEVDLTGLTILQGTCGWGEIHVNSNINGGKLSVDGKQYDRGIATHANSVLIFDLPENAAKFTAMAGIDNTGSDQGSKSSIEFMVFNYDPTYRYEYTDEWTGGNKLIEVDPTKQVATSGFVSRNSDYKYVDLEAPVKGAEKLYLVVTNGLDNLSYDHADWANPVLVRENGEEVSLTTIKWDANPLNGWYDPKLNKNNDGNTMTIDGVEYEYGFGVNAPSKLTFTMPGNHDFVSLKVRCGLDSDVDSAPFGATVEFRIFTENPTPNFDANVSLDLALLGLAEGQKAEITDLWTGEKLGSFSGKDFAPMIAQHGSGLYKVAPADRSKSADVAISKVNEDTENNSCDIKAVVIGQDAADSYIVFTCDDEIVGVMPLESDGTATYHVAALSGDYKAYFSGTPSVAPAESETLSVIMSGVKNFVSDIDGLTVTPGVGSVLIKTSNEGYLPIYDMAGQIVKTVKLSGRALSVNLAKGLYLVGRHKVAVR